MITAIIADDEPAVAVILSHFIAREGWPIQIVGTAEDGQTALDLIRSRRPDLVFLDIQMPIHNGLEIMSLERNARYIIITAYESFQYVQEALRLGARDLLLKPIEGEQLAQAIARTVGWRFTPNDLTNRMLAYLHRHYPETVDLPRLSAEFHVTPSHLTRNFKKYTGAGIVTYLNTLRVERAKTLLADISLTIREVASQVGYDSLTNFYKQFKRFTGHSPAFHRKQSGILEPGGVTGGPVTPTGRQWFFSEIK